MSSLEGRVALVTGAGRRRGIGRGIAMELARAGADVAVHARAWDGDPWPLEEIPALGRRVITVAGDLTEPGTASRIAGDVADALGPRRAPRGSARRGCRPGAGPARAGLRAWSWNFQSPSLASGLRSALRLRPTL